MTVDLDAIAGLVNGQPKEADEDSNNCDCEEPCEDCSDKKEAEIKEIKEIKEEAEELAGNEKEAENLETETKEDEKEFSKLESETEDTETIAEEKQGEYKDQFTEEYKIDFNNRCGTRKHKMSSDNGCFSLKEF